MGPDGYPVPEVRVHTDSQINAKLQFLDLILKKDLKYAIQLAHLSTCLANQNLLNLLRSLSEQNPNTMVHTLLSDHRYTAIATGTTLSVSKCEKITKYMFKAVNDSTCTLEYPATYIHRNEKKEGWHNGMGLTVVSTPTYHTCPRANFWFEIDDDVVLLLNNKKHNFGSHSLFANAELESASTRFN